MFYPFWFQCSRKRRFVTSIPLSISEITRLANSNSSHKMDHVGGEEIPQFFVLEVCLTRAYFLLKSCYMIKSIPQMNSDSNSDSHFDHLESPIFRKKKWKLNETHLNLSNMLETHLPTTSKPQSFDHGVGSSVDRRSQRPPRSWMRWRLPALAPSSRRWPLGCRKIRGFVAVMAIYQL